MQKATVMNRIDRRRTQGGSHVAGVAGEIESATTPKETAIKRTVLTIHSWRRRLSTASNEGVLKPRRPTTRASLRIPSTATSSFCIGPFGAIGLFGGALEEGSAHDGVHLYLHPPSWVQECVHDDHRVGRSDRLEHLTVCPADTLPVGGI